MWFLTQKLHINFLIQIPSISKSPNSGTKQLQSCYCLSCHVSLWCGKNITVRLKSDQKKIQAQFIFTLHNSHLLLYGKIYSNDDPEGRRSTFTFIHNHNRLIINILDNQSAHISQLHIHVPHCNGYPRF